ncbi:MAG: Rrf2 family transcriptional regulator [Cyanobacteriota bacterium]|nr:Rrf2 family transcriptional regulator [Cyanobacteriota bacterium]
MPFSAKTEYGLVALIDLAGAYSSGELLATGEICRRHGIPERYLEQMLTALRKAGLLRSIRGPRGGFQLTRPPDKVTVREVEACLEGEISAIRQGERTDPEFRVLAELGERLEEARTVILNGVTLADLVQGRDSLRQQQPMFYI